MNIAIKNAARRSIRALGYDLRQHRPELIDFLQSRKINLVFDVGANRGQFGLALRAEGYCGSIVSFEPASKPFEELVRKTRDDTNWTAHKVALGEVPGLGKLNVSRSDTFSSLLAQTKNACAFEESSTVDHVEEVEIFRMDDLCDLKVSDRAFLKVDAQGFERQILSGAPTVLSKVLGVLLEIPIVHMYENVWRVEDAIGFMRSLGFVLAQIKPVNFLWRQDPVSVSEFDCVFRRIAEALDAANPSLT
jgi:FkbM family methyltransferase